MLGEAKYGSGSGHQCSEGGTCYQALYKALLEEPVASHNTVTLLDEIVMTESRYRVTLDPWKIYLNSYATYHTFFVKELLARVQKVKDTMTGSCNSGTTSTNTQGWYGEFKVWLNEMGIANLLSILMLENSIPMLENAG